MVLRAARVDAVRATGRGRGAVPARAVSSENMGGCFVRAKVFDASEDKKSRSARPRSSPSGAVQLTMTTDKQKPRTLEEV